MKTFTDNAWYKDVLSKGSNAATTPATRFADFTAMSQHTAIV